MTLTKWVLSAAVAVWVTGCGPTEAEPILAISVTPKTITGQQVATVKVTATDAKSQPGTGTVNVTATAGSLAGGADVDLVSGQAEIELSCDRTVDPACAGAVRITATWTTGGKTLESRTAVTVPIPVIDAGTDAGFDAGVDAGPPPIDGGVRLTSAKSRIYVDVAEPTLITAALIDNGRPTPGREFTVTTTLGTLSYPDGGDFSGLGTTDSMGTLALELRSSTQGVATVTATEVMSNLSSTVSVEALSIGTITYVDTLCSGAACRVMGLRSSGFNNKAFVRFQVRDSKSTPQPVAGLRVQFELQNAPTGTTVATSGVTDALGNVDAEVNSGDLSGSFTVKATIVPGLSAFSPNIGVRGAKVSNRGFTLQCSRVNIAAWVAAVPPLAIQNACTLTLQDRLSNPIGVGTTVTLLTEAGAVPNAVQIRDFTAGSGEGTGTFAYSSTGTFPPEDVPPLPAAPTQYPFARLAEPSRTDSALTRNPRDGLVTILAYTIGEEYFADDNANGVQDGAEQFIDQGEPFLDTNDDDLWSAGERYIDIDLNGSWTPPNGKWDATSSVWTKAYVLVTDKARVVEVTPSSPNIAKGATGRSVVEIFDFNLNRLEAGSVFTMSRTGSRGTVGLSSTNALNLDDYGFRIEVRILLNAAGTGACLPSTPICSYFTRFGGWQDGFAGYIDYSGAPTTDMGTAETAVLTLGFETRGVTVPFPASVTFL